MSMDKAIALGLILPRRNVSCRGCGGTEIDAGAIRWYMRPFPGASLSTGVVYDLEHHRAACGRWCSITGWPPSEKEPGELHTRNCKACAALGLALTPHPGA